MRSLNQMIWANHHGLVSVNIHLVAAVYRPASDLVNPGLVENFNCYLFTVKGGFFAGLRFREKKFVNYNLLGHNFVANSL